MADAPRLPEILATEILGDRAQFALRIPADLLYFRGHFDGAPILPGVVQIHWAMLLARSAFGVSGVPGARMQVKFRQPILPLAALRLSLVLTRQATGYDLDFKYAEGDEIASSGKIGFIPGSSAP